MLEANAFTEVFQAHYQRVHGYLCSRSTDRSAVDDLVSETFLKAWLAWPTYVENGKLERWLLTLAFRVMIDATREPHRRHSYTASDGTNLALERTPSASAEDDLGRCEDDEWVEYQLARITPQQRTVIALSDAGYANGEIADMTGIRYGAVKALKMRGLHSLRRLMTVESRSRNSRGM